MESCTSSYNISNIILETWEFFGKISYSKIVDNTYGTLKGSMFIIKQNNKKEIRIKGTIKRENENKQKDEKNFYLHGVESDELNINSTTYKINNEKDSKLIFYKDIIMTKKNSENAMINGELMKGENILILEINLYLPKPIKDQNKIIVSNYKYTIMKLDKPLDILSNSICGFKNLINTCYINSSFQILIHIPQFIEIIRENNDFKDNVIEDINSIFDMILKNYKTNPIINPSEFVVNFKQGHDDYNNYSQNDSETFLEDLIWNINSVLSILNDKRITYYYDTTTIKKKLYYEYIKKSEEDTYYKINDLFYVLFVHEKKCELCKYITYYFDETVGLKLSFGKINYENQKIDLNSLIMENYKFPLKITSTFYCQNCQKCYDIIESIKIAKLPKILILTLQKTNIENTKKIPWIVQYDKDKEIEIKDIVDSELYKQGNYEYNIFAINNHSGYSPRAGHYYSYIYLEYLDSWFSFNDESVTPISEVKPGLNNYVLFYKQKKNYNHK